MTTDTFASPDPVEIIPADQIRPLIAATERELEVLERTAAEAIAAADDAEAWERAATTEGDASAWSLIRLHREQRDEAQRDAQVMIDLATRHAQYVIDEARAEAAEILAQSAPLEARVVESEPRRPAPPAAPVVQPPPPSAPPASGPAAPQASATRTAQATAVLEAPTVQIPVVVPEPAPVVVPAEVPVQAPVQEVVPPPSIPAPPVVAEPVVVPPQVAAAAPPQAVAPAQPQAGTDAFWSPEGSAKRRFSLPFSAVLEASAVLLILVFILLRLS